jgi:hypothetical protein
MGSEIVYLSRSEIVPIFKRQRHKSTIYYLSSTEIILKVFEVSRRTLRVI